MLQALKWTESFFTGLAIVLIALAVVAVPSNHVWGDPPGDPGEILLKACGGRFDDGQFCAKKECTQRTDCKNKKEEQGADKVGCDNFATGCTQCWCLMVIGKCGCYE